jgi:hypothetical protein
MNNLKIFALGCAFLLIIAPWAKADVYKTVGPDGKVQYADKASEDEQSKSEKLKLQPSPPIASPRRFAPSSGNRVEPEGPKRYGPPPSTPAGPGGESAECRNARENKRAAEEGTLYVTRGYNARVKVDQNNARLFDNDIQVYCQKK